MMVSTTIATQALVVLTKTSSFLCGLVVGVATMLLLLNYWLKRATKSLIPMMLGTTSSDEMLTAKVGTISIRGSMVLKIHQSHLFQKQKELIFHSSVVW